MKKRYRRVCGGLSLKSRIVSLRKRGIRQRIEDFYDTHDIPEEIDVLAQSGFCEALAMMTD